MPKMSTLLGRMNRISVSRRAASTILYFGMVGLGLSGVVVKLSTTGPVQLSNGLLMCVFVLPQTICLVRPADATLVDAISFGLFYCWGLDV
jgi:uncharacterized membrane protein